MASLSEAGTELYATCGAGLAELLATELRQVGLSGVQSAGAGVRFRGGLAAGYKACLWSRIANRVVVPIHQGAAQSPEELYSLVQEIDWAEHVSVDGSLAVDFYTAKSIITHSQYGALKVKDAVVDQFRDTVGRRPDVERDTPDLSINVYLFRDKARIAIDLSGSSLHRRGYREAQGLAPLKENLAAALLYAADWPDNVSAGLALADPLCGSGTLLIEAAMMACQIAPGLSRPYFGFLGWKGHDAEMWEGMKAEAAAMRQASPVAIVGSDSDERAISNCLQNIEQAGLQDSIQVEHLALSSGRPGALQTHKTGLVMTNPPYGERLAADDAFYASLGADISRAYAGWACSLFTAEAAPYHRARLPLRPKLQVRNGGIDCVLLVGDIPRGGAMAAAPAPSVESASAPVFNEAVSEQAEHPQSALYRKPHSASVDVESQSPLVDIKGFVNRLKKNQRALKGWLGQNGITAYRLYDADLPEFAVAIDVYESDERHCVVQEYQAPPTVNLAMAQLRLKAIVDALPEALGVESSCVHLKVREVQSGLQQYEKQSSGSSSGSLVNEAGAILECNFTDYLDTGLFLDHRPVRRYLQQNSQGKRFLNLFAYTGTATVAAVLGGATRSVSVDTSKRYCQWAMRNLDRNKAAMQAHEVVRQDVNGWLADASVSSDGAGLFDLILLDPPTFSNSSSLETDWNVQRDHVETIDACLALLAPGGTLIFSNNFRRFKLDTVLTEGHDRPIDVEDRSRWSIDKDFQRNPRIHQCWFIRKYESR